MDLQPGQILRDRYRIERQLGAGGMGAVYLAYDATLEVQVAVKANRNPSNDSTSQFLQEARLLASLRHPNLPRVMDYFVIENSQFLVMDYIAGDDLDTILEREGPQPVEKVLAWAEQIGSALTYLHSQQPPVIHRDIKPANLKLTLEGEVTLVDFGIAKAADSTQATAAGAMGYTPGFAPPEQYGGARTGPFSDQYALGATLYALLTGKRPVDGVQRVLGQAVLTPLHLLIPNIPASVQSAVERAMSPRPEERFPSVAAFITALQAPSAPTAAAAQRPAAAPTLSAAPGAATQMAPRAAAAPPQPRRRTPWGWLALGGGLISLLVLAGLVVGGYFLLRPKGTPQAQLPAVTITAPAASEPTDAAPTPALADTPVPTLEPSPLPLPSDTPQPEPSPTPSPRALGSERRVAFLSDRADGQTLQIWTMKAWLDNAGKFIATDFTQVTFDEGDKLHPAWSPDGTRLLYSAPGDPGNGLDIFLLDLANPSAPPVNLTRLKGDDTYPAWSPDGQTIAFTNTGRYVEGIRALYFMDPSGGNRVRVSEDFQEYAPFWYPDGQWLLYVINARDHNYLFMREAKTEFKTPEPYDKNDFFGRLGEVADPAVSPDGSQIAYTRIDGKKRAIYVADYRQRGGKVTNLTEGQTAESDPTWSPDSLYIAFQSERDGNAEIYLMTAVGQLATNLTNHPGRDLSPVWQPFSP